MESKNRGVWIIVAAIVVLACCGLLACSAAGVGLLVLPPLDRFSDRQSVVVTEGDMQTQRISKSFEIGSSPTLRIDSFGGGVTVRGDEVETIQAVATRKARRRSDLDRLEVTMTERDGGLEIETRNPSRAPNVSVLLEIRVPAATHLEVDLGAGSVVVEGLTGGVQVDNAAGAIVLKEVSGGIRARTAAGYASARGAKGPVTLESAAGVVDYQGVPKGDCHFGTAAGSISLDLPADADVAVDLRAKIGAVDAACDVEGTTTGRRVEGTIGSGAQGTVTARATVGDIDMVCR
jgi:hypothetical protein